MKQTAWLLSGALLLTSLAMFSCNSTEGSTENKTEKVEEAEHELRKAENKLGEAEVELQVAKKDSVVEFTSFKMEAERILAANEAAILVLKTKIEKQKSAFKDQYKKETETLEKENEKLRKKLKAFSLGTTETYESFKASVNRDMDNLGNSILKIAEKSETEPQKQDK